MDTFPIVRRKDEAEYGEYDTKRVILEIYDEMAAAKDGTQINADRTQINTDKEVKGKDQRKSAKESASSAFNPSSHPLYQTRLDPPPAHPDAAHAWDEEYLGPELPKDQWWQDRTQINADRTQIRNKRKKSAKISAVISVISVPFWASSGKPQSASKAGQGLRGSVIGNRLSVNDISNGGSIITE